MCKDVFLYAALLLPCGETLPPPHSLRSPCVHSAHRAQSTSRPEHQPPHHGHAAVRDRQASRLPSVGTRCTREPPAPPWKCRTEPKSQTPKPHGLSVHTAVQQRPGRGAVGGMCRAGLPWGRRAPFLEATTPGPRASATQARTRSPYLKQQHPLGACEKQRTLGPSPDLLNQNLHSNRRPGVICPSISTYGASPHPDVPILLQSLN